MNLIVLDRHGAARSLRLPLPPAAAAAAVIVTLTVGGIVLGFSYARSNGSQLPEDHVGMLQSNLTAQQAELQRIRETAGEQLDALALRLGTLNADVIRLNALGRRLTSIAKLDDGEFDFDSPPALGGPEEPAVSGSYGQLPDLLADLDGLAAQLDDQEQQLAALEGMMLNRKLYDRVHPSGKPVKSGYISSFFGKRTDPFTGKPANHRGIDFSGRTGAEVIAVAAGVVSWSADRYGYGNMVEINHGNGYFTRYAHNSENLVAVGDQVQPGQNIARMGSTGRATGPNLHFEVWRNGRAVDPRKYISQTD